MLSDDGFDELARKIGTMNKNEMYDGFDCNDALHTNLLAEPFEAFSIDADAMFARN